MKYPTLADEKMKQFVVMTCFSGERGLIIFPESRPDYWHCLPIAMYQLTEKDAVKIN